MDMKAVIAAQKLCFAATVTPDGKPNLSPKGTLRMWDGSHLFFCDIASPVALLNLMTNPWIEINVVDTLSRRGYRFFGQATIHVGGEIYEQATKRIQSEEVVAYHVQAVILIEMMVALPLMSPRYDYVKSESEMRALWKEKRRRLDEEFEAHLKRSHE